MKRITGVLVAILLVQVALIFYFITGGNDYHSSESDEPLLDIDMQAIDKITIESSDAKLLLTKANGQWQLPELDNSPVSEIKFKQVFDKLALIEKGWPNAITAEAKERFKVSPEQFERKLTFYKGEQLLQTLYIGTSPSFRKVHVRLGGDGNIYTVKLSAFEFATDPQEWRKRIEKEQDVETAEEKEIEEEESDANRP